MTEQEQPVADHAEAAPARYSAVDIARALGQPEPTPQQQAVIQAPLAPALVVAGAGSGKTETMANRVLWLLANGHVLPSEVLGLTFTRKAAGELAVRIRERIEQLAAAGLTVDDHDPFQAPVVATYNSFANTIFRDNAILVGREGDGAVLGEAGAWQLARATVMRSSDPRLPGLDRNLDPVTTAVLGLSRALAENVADPDEVRDFARRFAAVGELPAGGRGAYADVDRMVAAVGALDVLVDLVGEYDAAKLARSAVEYSDQVALALRIVRAQPVVAEELRARYRVVLLDEYQDTSVVQTWLLAELFAGHPVMAVGDPNQSIYGWRGASASNLEQFAAQFGASGPVFALSTSWRNGRRILDAANQLVRPLSAASRVPVEELVPSPVASALPIEVLFAEDLESEADAVAAWFAARVGRPKRDGELPGAAMLFRARKTQPVFLRKLREHGVKYHVLGIGGLLAEPEIADLVSMLSVLVDPGAGLELVRVLAGSRWRIGVRDLHALNRLASWLRDRDHAQQVFADDVREQLRSSLTEGEGGSIVDALDFLATAREGHTALAHFSELGLARLRDAGQVIARLRSRASLSLPDLVSLVEQELRLDIEVVANEDRPLGGAPMEALFDAIDGYLALDDVSTRVGSELNGFLAWLRAAEEREDLSPRPEDPEPGTVQILTIHGAKGLEWDLVAVPRLVAEELPSRPIEGTNGWLAFGQLPWPFRGDSTDLPEYDWMSATTRKELVDERGRFKAAVGRRAEDEERRLAYVAVTRARHELLLSGAFWATQKEYREPSVFLRELAMAEVIPELPAAPENLENPLGDDQERIVWPLDPLGRRRAAVEAAAEAVRAAEPAIAGRWADELELLLTERTRRLAGAGAVPLPTRVPASRFKDFVSDPGSVASSLLRPMPERPFTATRLGTLFHSWVENRYGLGSGADELDAGAIELDDGGDGVDAADLARLQAIFEASPWATRRPVEVEREIHLPFGDRIVICKIDAVYRTEGDRFEVVDWKTGKAPKDADDLERKQLQLALYRLAYSRWAGIDPARIDAAFYFVADDLVIRPAHIDSEDELLARWRAAFA
ncbi:ATP-dependent helicase [Lysinimonas soli]|uniref:DNA 3'-5' helicase n=1 Tax=Lysinimonas soli TaxID=1074233 RepID=A0ABW0NMR0_9MICO